MKSIEYDNYTHEAWTALASVRAKLSGGYPDEDELKEARIWAETGEAYAKLALAEAIIALCEVMGSKDAGSE